MSSKETKLVEVTIGGVLFLGNVKLHLHEIDGSQTILIRTPRREAVDEFLNSEIVSVND